MALGGKKRSGCSKRWLQEHFNDAWVQRSQADGYRSRASYKLIEIIDKDKLIRPGQVVLDLGAAPGGWSQVAAQRVGDKGKVIASDILPMDAIAGVTFVQGDFTEDAIVDALQQAMGSVSADCVLSDMAPNFSGVSATDQPRAMYLVELALDMARTCLKPGGHFVVKVFQGEGFDPYLAELRQAFSSVVVRKPDASRSRSREVYLVAKAFKGC